MSVACMREQNTTEEKCMWRFCCCCSCHCLFYLYIHKHDLILEYHKILKLFASDAFEKYFEYS